MRAMKLPEQEMNHFTVDVLFDAEADVWVAQCDALGIATEAADYEALTRRVWVVAPEMYAANGFGAQTDNFRLAFRHTQEAHAVA